MGQEYTDGMSIYEPELAAVGTNNQITNQPDSWGAFPLSQPTSGNQIFKGMRNGYDSWVWPDTTGSRRLQSTANNPGFVYFLMVMQYKTGVETTFAVNTGFARGYGGNTERIIGRTGTPNMFDTAGQCWTGVASVNAKPYGIQVLPLPMSLIEFKGTPMTGFFDLGWFGSTSSAWQGPGWLCIAMTVEPTGDVLARLQGWVAWRFGLQESLPINHPWRNEKPWVYV